MQIDFKALGRSLRERARELLPAWLPRGRWRGNEFVVGNVEGDAGDSLSIQWTTGVWKDFAGGPGGADLISLFAAVHHISNIEAARTLAGDTYTTPATAHDSIPTRKGDGARSTCISPAPAKAGMPSCVDYRFGKPVTVWIYRDATGAILGAVARYAVPFVSEVIDGVEVYITEDGKSHHKRPKTSRPWTWRVDKEGKALWRLGAWDRPRPLYKLDDLAARPDAPVMICEGEKAADAAFELAAQYVCMAWFGGVDGMPHADFSPLKGRNVLLWPDNDDVGIAAMWHLGYKLLQICRQVKIIIPGVDIAKGWDAADAILLDGFNSSDAETRWNCFRNWAVPLAHELKEEFNDGANTGDGGVRGNTESADTAELGAAGEEVSGHAQRERASQKADRGAIGADGTVTRDAAIQGGGGLESSVGSSGREVNQSLDSGDAGGDGRQVDTDAGTARTPVAKTQGKRKVRESGEGDVNERNPKAVRRADATKPPSTVRERKEIYWVKWGFDMTTSGKPHDNLSNAVAVIEQDPEWKGKIWYDTFLQRIIADVPGADGPREWSDFDDINLTLYMQRALGLTKISASIVGQAVVRVARKNLRNCVTDWMSSLKWDGEARLEEFFEDYFGAKRTNFTRAVSRNFWMSIVARAYMPGCKCDYMVVLEGAQGQKKSMAIEAVAGRAWFTVALEDIDKKDFFQTLRAKLVVEIGELEAFNRRGDMNRVKNVVSCATDNFRGSYKRHAEDHPRQCVFVGSTNRDDWNKDETGARRFWPIRTVGEIDVEGILSTREQYFAEAVHRLHLVAPDASPSVRMAAGADWWVVTVEEAKAEQLERFDEDSWTEHVGDFVALKTQVRIGEILTDGLKFDIADIKKGDEMRVGSILRSLGWERQVIWKDGVCSRLWAKKEAGGW